MGTDLPFGNAPIGATRRVRSVVIVIRSRLLVN
jgi:hypothetical protein